MASESRAAATDAAAGTVSRRATTDTDSFSHDLGQECIASVIENRAKEVGTAVLLVAEMRLHLMQFVETSRTYTNTMTMLELYQPSQLLVVATDHEVVNTGVNRATHRHKQISVPRGYFDDSKGALLVSKYAIPESRANAEIESPQNYLALGAAGALFRHLEGDQGRIVLAAGSVQVSHRNLRDHMFIDTTSVEALELIEPMQQTGAAKNNTSLFRLLNHTETRCGARLLKANLLQPLSDVNALELRLDALEELLVNNDLQINVQACLEKMPKDLDRMCSGMAIKPLKANNSDPARRMSLLVSSFILLRDTLALLPALAEALAPAQSRLQTVMRSTFEHQTFQDILSLVNEVLDEDVQVSKASFINRTQQCFAVKGEVDGFLDLARSIFCKITEQIHQMAESCRSEFQLPALKVMYAARRGFYFVLPKPGSKQKDGTAGSLPRGFVLLEDKSASAVSCTTHELNALNSRLKDAYNDCMLLTEQVLEGLQSRVCKYQEALQKLIDNIALLDMLRSLAHAVARSEEEYTRPQLSTSGPIAIVQGRHPIAQASLEQRRFQPNDTYLADCSSFQIVTGPNMSGKSTYLRQAALITVMAHIGCFVPASFASIRLVDQLFTRIGTSDSIETNSSSFMVEMQEVAYITSRATSRSLVIIDELGRATSTADGIGIAWAVSEYFISLGTFTLFATHFGKLTELAALYPNVKVWSCAVDTSRERLDFTWQLEEGHKEGTHYGLLLARIVGFPDQVLTEAQKIVEVSDAHDRERQSQAAADVDQPNTAAIYALAHKVACIADSWTRNPETIDICNQMLQLKREARNIPVATS